MSHDQGADLPLPHNKILAERFHSRLCRSFPPSSPCRIILVTHILPDLPVFLEALGRYGEISTIIPKPNSVHNLTRKRIGKSYTVRDDVGRTDLAEPQFALQLFEEVSGGNPVAILDIGGYFAPCLKDLYDRFGDLLLGVVEDTENGQQKYEKVAPLPVPVMSVARSPLKEPEDHITGESIVFSAERLIRSCGEVLFGRRAAVFGYGKIGRSIARTLQSRGVRVSVVDLSPIKSADAMSHGFWALDKRSALKRCDLIFAATGNLSLSVEDFQDLGNGSFIASVTSSDDELDLRDSERVYSRKEIGVAITKYERPGKYFYLLNGGNAVNFLDGAALGPYIHLVQGEILASLWKIQTGPRLKRPAKQTASITHDMRQKIAEAWLSEFNPGPRD